jgi:MSHA biogenesis protein MshO
MRFFKSKWNLINRKSSQGFTLIELVLVIIILGIMGIGVSGFITLSTQTYLNATNRDELIGNARFAIERLNRELRNAAPNSIRTQSFSANEVQCIQFTPIVASTVYIDIPVLPDPASKALSVIPFNDSAGDPYQCDIATGCTDLVTVYPLNSADIYVDSTAPIGKVFRVDNIDTTVDPWIINILNTQNISFDEDSPIQRLYLINEQISYCVVPIPEFNTVTLIRFSEDITNGVQSYPTGATRFYMAGYLDDISSRLPFNYQLPTLRRNAVVQVYFKFSKDDESYVFDHEVHINNVP